MDIEHLLWKIVLEDISVWTCGTRTTLHDSRFPVGIIAEHVCLAGEILNVDLTKSELTLRLCFGVGYFPFADGSDKIICFGPQDYR
jgi:hypothetical protein